MTQQTFPPVPPAGAQQSSPYGQPYRQSPGFGAPQQPQGFGAPQQQPGFGGPGAPYGPPPGAGFGYTPQPPKKKKTGVIIGSIVGALVLIGGLVVGAIFLFGSKTLDQSDAQKQVTSTAEGLIGVAPENVECPADIEVKTGGTFTCTGTVDGQDVSFTVTQKDEDGNVEIATDNSYAQVADVESEVASQAEDQIGVPVDVSCDAGGKTVLVDPSDASLTCTITNQEDSTDTADVAVTVGEDGSVTIEG